MASQLQQTDAALQESEQWLRLAQRAARIGTWEWNVQTGEVSWSEGIWRLLGLEQNTEEPSIQPWIDFIHPDDREQAMRNVETVFAHGENYYDEFRILRGDGSIRWLASQGQVIRNAQGQVERFLGVNIDISDRKQVEEALETYLAQLEAVINSITEGLVIADPQGNVLMFNPAPLAMHGFQSLEEVRQHVQSFASLFDVRELDGQPVAVADWPISHALAGKTFSGRRLQLHRTDTGKRWVAQYGGTPVRNKAGEVILAIVTISDITVMYQAEQEREQLLLREQAARVEAETAREQITKILESITDGFLAFDREWRFTYLNHEGTRTLGRSAEELLGKNLWEEFPELAQSSFGRMYKRAVAEGVPLELEDYYPPFDAWFSARAYPSAVGLTLYFLNISDRKRAEAQIAALNRDLQKRVDELETLFEVIPIGILISEDPEFKQVRANPAFAEILGISQENNASYTPPEGNHSPPYKIFRNGKQLRPEETPLRFAAIHGVTVQGAEVDILRHDGKLFNLYGYAAPLYDDQGKVRGAVGAFLDITERKVAEAERERLLQRERIARETAETANRIKDEFLAVLSHELRTPLNPILGWTKLLRTKKLDEAKIAFALETIERNAKLQTQLIEDLLDVSRILQGKLTLQVCPVDLVVTIEAAKETVRLAAEAKSIQIETKFEPTNKQVSGDPNRLQQVVWNLLSNAVKFTPNGGQIHIKLEYIDTYAQITVKDTGKGINPEFLPYVFDAFRQADGTTTRKFGGLGLGLAIVRHIVEMHGGSVSVESEGEGQGATFTVKLPLADTTVEANQKSTKLEDSPSLHGVAILVVDDEPDTREVISFVLEQAGANVTKAASAREALEILAHSLPNILVCDIGMPEIDGYMLIRQVRTRSKQQGGEIPAIALTAYAGEVNQQQAIAAGFQKHLSKPVGPEELVRAIASLYTEN